MSQLTFACIPEPDHVKKVPFIEKEEKEAAGKDDIELQFQNVGKYLGAPAPCKMCVARQGTTERPSLFWRLAAGGSGTRTESEAKANVQMWHIKVGFNSEGDICCHCSTHIRFGANIDLYTPFSGFIKTNSLENPGSKPTGPTSGPAGTPSTSIIADTAGDEKQPHL